MERRRAEHARARAGPRRPATAPALIDPFAGGRSVGQEQLATLLGRAVALFAEHLAPMPNRAVLVRLLLNQATRAEAGGDPARALMLYERMTAISPAAGHAWWGRARLELVRGDAAVARASLSAMLEMTGTPRRGCGCRLRWTHWRRRRGESLFVCTAEGELHLTLPS